MRRWANAEPQRKDSRRFQSVLTETEERDIVEAMIVSSSLGWPCSTDELQVIAQSYLNYMNKETSFVDNMPGTDWIIKFKKRWSAELGTRKPEILSKPRAENLTVETLSEFLI